MSTEQNPAALPAAVTSTLASALDESVDPAATGAPLVATPLVATPLVATPPRTRWAAVIWGLLFAAIAGAGIWLLTDAQRQSGIADWVMELTPSTLGGLAVLVAGVLVLATGAVGLIRHAQRRYAASRT
ncbi:hypothetical protein [Microbacterium sp. NPDC087665]|uniref:hypothetical protein n=1 Tax=Microbacterium sp. NPDC087665 TaxID=3364194 RepID=UPI0037F3D4BB